ncbi:hypothetical protein [Streptomyces sp. NPDC048172]|uniref:SbtR family transcriptional regulator n=1 Tax=Streptomyces sp. NPDC048172 TaxID=3365505 RepID=UPI00371A0A0B
MCPRAARSCAARASGKRLLTRAQDEGVARGDIDATDLFALAGALAWLGDQPALAPRVDRLFGVVTDAVLTAPAARPQASQAPVPARGAAGPGPCGRGS